VLAGPRLRQVALVAADCAFTARRLQDTFGWPEPFHDPGVAEFGLSNAVFATGDTFIEVVAPMREGTTAGRYRERRGGDSGYMAIFQMPDLAAARRRLPGLGVRVVWTVDLPDMAGTHLHPKDVPGAIVSLDWADPPGSWRWAGPAWTGRTPPHAGDGIAGITLEVKDPALAADRWSSVLDLRAVKDEPGDGMRVDLPDAGQRLRFVPAAGAGEGIAEIILAGWDGPETEIAGVRFIPESTL
jgi:hypothetical protein